MIDFWRVREQAPGLPAMSPVRGRRSLHRRAESPATGCMAATASPERILASVWYESVMSEDRFLSGSGSVSMITTTSSAYLLEGYRSSFSKSSSTVSP